MHSRILLGTLLGLTLAVGPALRSRAADVADEGMVKAIISLVTDKDGDVRSVGLEQVRESAKGAAATRQFAALLPTLTPEAQAGLLLALGGRGDPTARPAALEMLKSPEQRVRIAATAALGSLGNAGDVPLLVGLLSAAEPEEMAGRAALCSLAGREVDVAIAAEMPKTKPKVRGELIGVLVSRHATGTASIGALAAAAGDADADISLAAYAALGQLAAPEEVPNLLKLVLAAPKGSRREGAEKAVMFVCARVADPQERAATVLAVMAKSDDKDQITLLPTLGRVGGNAARKRVEAAMADADPARHAAGLRALCNWPDASVTGRLLDLAQTAAVPAERDIARLALIRVAPLPDKRPGAEKLALLQKAMTLAANDSERNLIIKRARAVRTIECLHFVLPYLDKPEFAQQACDTIVELAHHKELREPNRPEFERALDAVIRTSKDPKVIDAASRYKKGQT